MRSVCIKAAFVEIERCKVTRIVENDIKTEKAWNNGIDSQEKQ